MILTDAPHSVMALGGGEHPRALNVAQLLAQDIAFTRAVKSGDVYAAAQVGWRFFQAHSQSDDPMSVDGMPAPPRPARRQRDSIGDPTNLRVGDWVSIQGVKRSSDSELLGHHAQVIAIEPGGWVELSVQKLGVTARLQQRLLVPLNQAEGALGGRPLLPGDQSGDSDDGGTPLRGGGGGGAFGWPGSAHPAQKRHHFEGYLRPAHIGHPLPPARVPLLLARGVGRARDVLQAVRRELLGLEDVVPWECVTAGWKAKRGAWRKALRALDISKVRTQASEVVVMELAIGMQQLQEALLTDTSPGTPGAVLVRGGVWEARLLELAAGGNNFVCLQHVWDEMHEAVRAWLHGQGHALPPPPPGTAGSQPLPVHTAAAAAAVSGGVATRAFDKALFPPLLAAVRGLLAGCPDPDPPFGQVVADRVVALGRDAARGLRVLLAAADELELGPALEAFAAACDLPALLGVTRAELDRLGPTDVAALLLLSPAVRAELRMVRGVDSEPPTDAEDAGGDMTDCELSD